MRFSSTLSSFLNRGIFAIAAILLLRAVTLESMDLIDPTEARYASVAQEMVLSGDWTTPKLPLPGGIASYLSKPPLHYWLTAISYSIFGIDEWSARLPSFLALCLMAYFVWWISSKTISKEAAPLATGICISSSLLFFLSGASVVDVTLAAWTTGAFAGYVGAVLEADKKKRNIYGLSIFFFAALGFLTKGPIALVLIGFPLFTWSLWMRGDFSLKRFPWLGGIALFILVSAPWFIVTEQANPGFIKYYFWNENIARYLFKNYGDRYVSKGSVYPYGSAWWMLLVAFLPWTPVLLFSVFVAWREKLLGSLIKENSWAGFFTVWGLSGAVFLTFIRQLHAAYLLPNIPALAMVTSYFLLGGDKNSKLFERIFPSLRALICFGLIATLFFIPIGLAFGSDWIAILASLVLITILALYIYKPSKDSACIIGLGNLTSVATALVFSVATIQASHHAGERKSAQDVLKRIILSSNETIPKVGMIHENIYSPFWYARAWKDELGEPVEVVYVDQNDILSSNLKYILVKKNHLDRLPKDLWDKYQIGEVLGSWAWLVIKPPQIP